MSVLVALDRDDDDDNLCGEEAGKRTALARSTSTLGSTSEAAAVMVPSSSSSRRFVAMVFAASFRRETRRDKRCVQKCAFGSLFDFVGIQVPNLPQFFKTLNKGLPLFSFLFLFWDLFLHVLLRQLTKNFVAS